jgi:hypothetical protein
LTGRIHLTLPHFGIPPFKRHCLLHLSG